MARMDWNRAVSHALVVDWVDEFSSDFPAVDSPHVWQCRALYPRRAIS